MGSAAGHSRYSLRSCVREGRTAGPSAALGMTKWRVALTSASVLGDGERCRSFAILPAQLRSGGAHRRSLGCARDDKVEGGAYLCVGFGGWGALQVIRDTPCAVAFGRGAPQVPRLRSG